MTTEPTTKEPTATVKAREAALNKIRTAYAAATAEDKALVKSLLEKADKPGAEMIDLPPGAAAILFLDHNQQNREWKHQVSEAYAEEINDGKWEFTNQGLGLLVTGNLGDGQHRAGGGAMSGKTVRIVVAFGMAVTSIIAVDTGHRRQASDFLAIEKAVAEPKRKQAVLKQAFSTLKKYAASDEEARPYVLTTNRDTVNAIKAHDRLLTDAIEIGDESVRGRSKPTLKVNEAAALSLVFLLKGWPKAKIIADLDIFQSGEDREGGSTPLFVAADQLAKDAAKKDGHSTAARFAVAIKAFVLHEQGVKAVRVADIRAAMKAKEGIDATFPGPAQLAAE